MAGERTGVIQVVHGFVLLLRDRHTLRQLGATAPELIFLVDVEDVYRAGDLGPFLDLRTVLCVGQSGDRLDIGLYLLRRMLNSFSSVEVFLETSHDRVWIYDAAKRPVFLLANGDEQVLFRKEVNFFGPAAHRRVLVLLQLGEELRIEDVYRVGRVQQGVAIVLVKLEPKQDEHVTQVLLGVQLGPLALRYCDLQ